MPRESEWVTMSLQRKKWSVLLEVGRRSRIVSYRHSFGKIEEKIHKIFQAKETLWAA